MTPDREREGADHNDPLLPLLEELDRLEDLLEEMAELGVGSRADVERRLTELNARVDELSDDG